MKLQDFEKKIIIIAVVLLICLTLFYFYGKSAKIKIENFKKEASNTDWNFPTEKINSISESLDRVEEIKNSEEVKVLEEFLTEEDFDSEGLKQNQQEELKNDEQ